MSRTQKNNTATNGTRRVTCKQRHNTTTVTNTNCHWLDGAVRVEFRYINGVSCGKADHSINLTPCDTLTLMTNVHTGMDQGYLYIYAKSLTNTDANSNGDPIVSDSRAGRNAPRGAGLEWTSFVVDGREFDHRRHAREAPTTPLGSTPEGGWRRCERAPNGGD